MLGRRRGRRSLIKRFQLRQKIEFPEDEPGNTPISAWANAKLIEAHAPRDTFFVELWDAGTLRMAKPQGCDSDQQNNSHEHGLRSMSDLRKIGEITNLPRRKCFRRFRLMCLTRSATRYWQPDQHNYSTTKQHSIARYLK